MPDFVSKQERRTANDRHFSVIREWAEGLNVPQPRRESGKGSNLCGKFKTVTASEAVSWPGKVLARSERSMVVPPRAETAHCVRLDSHRKHACSKPRQACVADNRAARTEKCTGRPFARLGKVPAQLSTAQST